MVDRKARWLKVGHLRRRDRVGRRFCINLFLARQAPQHGSMANSLILQRQQIFKFDPTDRKRSGTCEVILKSSKNHNCVGGVCRGDLRGWIRDLVPKCLERRVSTDHRCVLLRFRTQHGVNLNWAITGKGDGRDLNSFQSTTGACTKSPFPPLCILR